jgi:hypothetical protein
MVIALCETCFSKSDFGWKKSRFSEIFPETRFVSSVKSLSAKLRNADQVHWCVRKCRREATSDQQPFSPKCLPISLLPYARRFSPLPKRRSAN